MSKSPRSSGASSSDKLADKSADRSATEPSFEKAIAELERLVAQMEGGTLSLEQALAAHKRGLELARLCQARLEAAQQQVRVLEGEVLKPLAAQMADDGDGE